MSSMPSVVINVIIPVDYFPIRTSHNPEASFGSKTCPFPVSDEPKQKYQQNEEKDLDRSDDRTTPPRR